jgi:hypothetical protein
LLDWLERRLNLTWLETPPEVVEPEVQPAQLAYPERSQLDALRELLALGYYRGILNQLDDIELASPHCAPFVANMRELAKQFQFETMISQLASFSHDT